MENFVEKYLPMRVMAQLQEIMAFVWQDSPESEEIRRLKELETITSKQFAIDLLKDLGKPDLIAQIEKM